MKRPVGITILALIHFILAGFMAVLACAVYAQTTTRANLLLRHFLPDAYDSTETLVFLVSSAAILLVIGTGLWTLQGWAWWAMMVVVGVPLGRNLVYLAVGVGSSPSLISTIPSSVWLWLIMNSIIVLYMARIDVRQAFRRTENLDR